jgi:hypothetical protein
MIVALLLVAAVVGTAASLHAEVTASRRPPTRVVPVLEEEISDEDPPTEIINR